MSDSIELKEGDLFLGKYQIEKMVATGSLGENVYKAENTATKRPAFVRILPPEVSSDKEFVERFFQQIQLTSRLNHSHILKAVETGKEKDCHYFITSYSPGQYLDTYLVSGRKMDEGTALRLMTTLTDALNYAWKTNKILHRNLAPETILVNHRKEGVLTDFGFAKRISASSRSLTIAGSAIGRPDYMSPEQFDTAAKLDCRSDIYCMGLVLYQILVGRHPFSDIESAGDLITAHLKKDPPPVNQVEETVSAGTAAVVAKMLRKNPDDRYSDWSEVQEDLQSLLAGGEPIHATGEASGSADATGSRSDSESRPGISKNVIIVAVVVVIVLALVAAAIFFLAGGTKG
jgi:serine/threonine-protein kinase